MNNSDPEKLPITNPNVEFDEFSINYENQIKSAVSISGEDPEYFQEYKVKDLKNTVNRMNLPYSTIFDFGCGVGGSLGQLNKFFPTSVITGGDVSRRSLLKAKSRYKCADNIKFLEIDGGVNLPTSSQDIVFSACVFHHIEPKDHIFWIQELVRVLKPGGILFIYEHNPYNPVTTYVVKNCPLDINAILIKPKTFRSYLRGFNVSKVRVGYKVFFPKFLKSFRSLEDSLKIIPLGAQYCILAIKG